MIVIADTSAINAAFDDNCEPGTLEKFKRTHRLLFTSENLLEVVSTTDEERRHQLLTFMKALSDGTRPLTMANKLLQRVTKAHYRRRKLTLTVEKEDAAFWYLLNEPERASEVERQEASVWKSSVEESFAQAHRDARPAFQDLFKKQPADKPFSISALMRYFRKNDEAVYSFFKKTYKKLVGKEVSRAAMWAIFESVPAWPLYLGGWAHEMYRRAIAEQKFGAKGKPGSLDLWFAIFLPFCDVLVTNDRGQYKALRLLARLNTEKRTRVMLYKDFRLTFCK